jgi:hypothetical protein
MSPEADLLAQLDECKGLFAPGAARRTEILLKQIRGTRFESAAALIHLHETLLFLRAYPQSVEVARLCDAILFDFGRRVRRVPPEQLAEFEYAEVSGIAGTGITTNFSYVFAKSLAERYGTKTPRGAKHRGSKFKSGAALNIDWEQFEHVDRLAPTLAHMIPAAREAWALGRHIDWRKCFESAAAAVAESGVTQKSGEVQWLLEHVRPDVYDLLEVPLRFELGDSNASRSRARIPRRSIYFHKGVLLARKDISFEDEFIEPPIRVTRLARDRAHYVLGVIVDASAVRYRELYGFEYPDETRVHHAALGRGMDFFFFGVPRHWRLHDREYCAGMYFKNGVPIGYVEVMWRAGVMEVGFNLYYTFRQGETAWLYARLLKLFHQHHKVTAFTIDPYQLGRENDEAIESGAFWFYAKLGFHSTSRRIRKLAQREQERIAANPKYRTPVRTLRKLAEAPMIYKIKNPQTSGGTIRNRAATIRERY